MSNVLEDKVVLVTGAGRGIGRSIALQAAAHGAKVVVNDYGVSIDGSDPSDAVAREVVDEIRAGGGDAITSAASVATSEGAHEMVAAAIDRWGRLDGVVNSAGVVRHRPFLEMSEEDWDVVVTTNLRGHFCVLQAAAKTMVEHNIRGSLVAVGSMYLAGHVVRANYRASKAGVLAMAMSAAIDLAEYGIRVNTLAPGAHTRMSVSSGAKAGAGPDDVAPMGVYLLSDLSADVTGQVFSAGGHRIAGWSDPYENRVVSSDSDWTPEIIAREMPYLLGRDTYRELSLKLPVPSPFRYLPASDAHDAS